MLNILVHCDSIHGDFVKALHGVCSRACKYAKKSTWQLCERPPWGVDFLSNLV